MGLHFNHLDFPRTYTGILFMDFSSAFNTIVPESFCQKLTQLTITAFTCQWITKLLTG